MCVPGRGWKPAAKLHLRWTWPHCSATAGDSCPCMMVHSSMKLQPGDHQMLEGLPIRAAQACRMQACIQRPVMQAMSFSPTCFVRCATPCL